MEYEFDFMMGLEELDLYYEAHMVGFDGECFTYSVYFDEELTEEKFKEMDEAIQRFVESYDEDTYLGYIDVKQDDGKGSIYLDIGNVEPSNENVAMKGILKALNTVSGINKVLVNEELEFEF